MGIGVNLISLASLVKKSIILMDVDSQSLDKIVRLRPRSNWGGVALDVNKKHDVVLYQCHGKANQLFEVFRSQRQLYYHRQKWGSLRIHKPNIRNFFDQDCSALTITQFGIFIAWATITIGETTI